MPDEDIAIPEASSIGRPAGCPRCGYDQRGAIAQWGGGTCPLDGQCTECGLEFAWTDVFCPTRRRPEWLVEFAAGHGELRRNSVVTSLRILWPWTFWRRVRMSHPFHPRKLGLYLVLLALLPPLIGWVGFRTDQAIRVRQALGDLVQTEIAELELLQQSLQTKRQLTIDPLERERLDARLVKVQEALDSTFIEHSYAAAVFEAIFLPWREASFGAISVDPNKAENIQTGGARPRSPFSMVDQSLFDYPSPLDLNFMFRDYVRGRGGWLFVTAFDGGPSAGSALNWLLFWSVVFLLLPLTFWLLPITRKRAKVRPQHFVRTAGYSAAVLLLVFHLLWLTEALQSQFGPQSLRGYIASGHAWLPSFALPLFMLLWWHAAVKHFLKLPHAFLIVFLLTVISALAPLLVTVLLFILRNPIGPA